MCMCIVLKSMVYSARSFAAALKRGNSFQLTVPFSSQRQDLQKSTFKCTCLQNTSLKPPLIQTPMYMLRIWFVERFT